MTKKITTACLLVCALWGQVSAQESYPDRARSYVKQYAQYAIADQRSTGVPASITLGQGILETEAGISELVTEANNHFGIKCKNGWQGATFLHDDDAKGECFKKYNSALESYHDHSAHLMRNQRYSVLFTYSPTDYARWAHGLKKCGYATNPKYAYQLIKIIEDYHLQEYTYSALDSNYKINVPGLDAPTETMMASVAPAKSEDTIAKTSLAVAATTSVINTTTVAAITATSTTAVVKDSATTLHNDSADYAGTLVDTANAEESSVIMVNGLKAIRVHKGEALLPYAVKLKVRYGHLLEINDMPEDPVPADMYIYLEKKHPAGLKSNHSVREGETLHMIAQEEGIQLKKLAAFNLLRPAEVPVTGAVLNLQAPALTKPAVKEVMLAYSSSGQEESAAEPEAQPVAANSSEQEVGFGMGFQNPAQAMPARSEAAAMAPPAEPHDEPVAAEPKPAKATGNTKHVVKKGETAFSIAKRYNVTVDDIASWNSVKPQNLKVGQTLLIKQ